MELETIQIDETVEAKFLETSKIDEAVEAKFLETFSSKYFILQLTEQQSYGHHKLTAKCSLCAEAGLEKLVKGDSRTNSNFIKHIQTHHEEDYEEFLRTRKVIKRPNCAEIKPKPTPIKCKIEVSDEALDSSNLESNPTLETRPTSIDKKVEARFLQTFGPKYFTLLSTEKKPNGRHKIVAKCSLCSKTKLVKGDSSSNSNFFKHLENVHDEDFDEFLLSRGEPQRRRSKSDKTGGSNPFLDSSNAESETDADVSSEPYYCLFCFKDCDNLTSKLEGGIVGAVRCPTLERQLLHYFILRRLLEVPSSWCEENLTRFDGDCNPESWFRLCDNCLQVVSEAWQIQQKILALESRMKNIQEELKQDMRRSIKVSKRKSKSRVFSIDNNIRTLIFPDLMIKPAAAPAPIPTPAFYDESLDDMTMDSHVSYSESDADFLIPDDTNVNDIDDYIGVLPEAQRRRGRKSRGSRSPRRKTSSKPKPAFHWSVCTMCPSRFSSEEEYSGHLEAHEESRKTGGMYDCKTCGFPARSNEDLELHVNDKHINKKYKIKKYLCSHCDFKSNTWKSLKSHLEEKHPDRPLEEMKEFDLKCYTCLKVFETKSTLMVHQKKMHPEMFGAERETLQCEHCSLRFPDKIRLTFHVNSIHRRINRFVCDDCGKGFRFIKALERHKITHQKDKRNFICHICGLDYAYASILQEHYRKYHPNSPQGSSNKNKEAQSEQGASGQDTRNEEQEEFKCKYCDLTTPFKPVLIRHMQTHKKEMGFQCDECDRSYTNSQGLRRHKAINHSDSKVQCPYCHKPFPHVEYMKTHLRLYCQLKTMSENANEPVGESDSNDQPRKKKKLSHPETGADQDFKILGPELSAADASASCSSFSEASAQQEFISAISLAPQGSQSTHQPTTIHQGQHATVIIGNFKFDQDQRLTFDS